MGNIQNNVHTKSLIKFEEKKMEEVIVADTKTRSYHTLLKSLPATNHVGQITPRHKIGSTNTFDIPAALHTHILFTLSWI